MALSDNLNEEKNKVATPEAWLVTADVTLTDGTEYALVKNDEDIVINTSYADGNLVAYYKLDELSGTNIVDAVSGNDGTWSGGSLLPVTGKVNGALDFSNTNDLIAIPASAEIDMSSMTNGFTFVSWNYIRSQGNLDGRLFQKGSNRFYVDDNTVDGSIIKASLNFGVGQDANSTTINRIPNDEWHQIAMVFDPVTKLITIYVDSVAVPQNQTAGTGTMVADTTAVMRLGNNQALTSNFDGYQDDVRLYNKQLDQAERDNIWNDGEGVEDIPVKYTAFNFQLDPSDTNSNGQIPTRTLRISNVTSLLQSKIQELNSGVGSLVVLKVHNTKYLNENSPDLTENYEVLETSSTNKWIELVLGSPSALRQPFPLNRYKAHGCNWRFESVECAYNRKVVVGVTLSNPVSLEITAHDFEVDDAITLYTINGITGGIEGPYLIKAVTDPNNVTIKTLLSVDVDGGDFAGVYTSGGEVGYTTCERTLKACRQRENSPRFGAQPGMRSGGVRIA